MREIRPSGSEGGARSIPCPYPYFPLSLQDNFIFTISTRHVVAALFPVSLRDCRKAP